MVKEIDEDELEELRRRDASLVDVRPIPEYEAGHVPGSVPIPVGELLDKMSELEGQSPIVVVSDECPEKALQFFEGYRNIPSNEVYFFDLENWSGDLVESEGAVKSYENISLDEGLELLDSDADWIDVRTPEEFEEERIPGARNVPVNRFRDIDLDESCDVVLYCNTGRRSRTASEFAAKQGYRNVKHLKDGIVKWKEAGHPVEIGGEGNGEEVDEE